jgi:hypothetical protein
MIRGEHLEGREQAAEVLVDVAVPDEQKVVPATAGGFAVRGPSGKDREGGSRTASLRRSEGAAHVGFRGLRDAYHVVRTPDGVAHGNLEPAATERGKPNSGEIVMRSQTVETTFPRRKNGTLVETKWCTSMPGNSRLIRSPFPRYSR